MTKLQNIFELTWVQSHRRERV